MQDKHFIILKKFSLTVIVVLVNILIIILTIRITENYLHRRQRNIEGITVTKINSSNLVLNGKNGNLKYYYEPAPYTKFIWNRDWIAQKVVNHMNSEGINSTKEFSVKKNQNTFRIIALGDSFTFGQFVNTKDNYISKLENLLNNQNKCAFWNKYEIINLGVSGYDIEYSTERFIRTGLKYNSDMIIWLINDWNFTQINEIFLPRYDELKQAGYKEFDNKTGNYLIAGKIHEELIDIYKKDGLIKYNSNIIQNFLSFYKKPVSIFTYTDLPETMQKSINDLIVNNKNLKYFSNLSPNLANSNLTFLDGHPNNLGHIELANEIFNILKHELKKYCPSG